MSWLVIAGLLVGSSLGLIVNQRIFLTEVIEGGERRKETSFNLVWSFYFVSEFGWVHTSTSAVVLLHFGLVD